MNYKNVKIISQNTTVFSEFELEMSDKVEKKPNHVTY